MFVCVCGFSTSASGLVAAKSFFWFGYGKHELPNADKTTTTKPLRSLSAASELLFLIWGLKSVAESWWFICESLWRLVVSRPDEQQTFWDLAREKHIISYSSVLRANVMKQDLRGFL